MRNEFGILLALFTLLSMVIIPLIIVKYRNYSRGYNNLQKYFYTYNKRLFSFHDIYYMCRQYQYDYGVFFNEKKLRKLLDRLLKDKFIKELVDSETGNVFYRSNFITGRDLDGKENLLF